MIHHRDTRKKERCKKLSDDFHTAIYKLDGNERAREYLYGRDVGDDLIDTFKIGWCPSSIRPKDYEFLSGRIVFPIFDEYGFPVSFVGRLPCEKKDIPSGVPHWCNESDFPKAFYLYNLGMAWKYILKYGFCIIVEGYNDVITCHKFGFKNAVAVMGTSLTKEHLSKITRFGSNLLLMFDSDPGGRKASQKTRDMISGYRDINTLDINLRRGDVGYDPDDFLRKFGDKILREHIIKKAEQNKFDLGDWGN